MLRAVSYCSSEQEPTAPDILCESLAVGFGFKPAKIARNHVDTQVYKKCGTCPELGYLDNAEQFHTLV